MGLDDIVAGLTGVEYLRLAGRAKLDELAQSPEPLVQRLIDRIGELRGLETLSFHALDLGGGPPGRRSSDSSCATLDFYM